MRAILSFLVLLALAVTRDAWADPLFQFSLSGDGHTFLFTTPNPPTVVDHPHNVDAGIGPIDGTVDGVSGYSFSADIIVAGDYVQYPVLTLYVDPLPVGLMANPMYGPAYELYGPLLTTLVSDVPNPDPQCYSFGVCNDLLTFAFVPDEYSLYGYDPAHNPPGSYNLTITAVASPTSAPEPAGWLLAITGAVMLACGMQYHLGRNKFALATR